MLPVVRGAVNRVVLRADGVKDCIHVMRGVGRGPGALQRGAVDLEDEVGPDTLGAVRVQRPALDGPGLTGIGDGLPVVQGRTAQVQEPVAVRGELEDDALRAAVAPDRGTVLVAVAVPGHETAPAAEVQRGAVSAELASPLTPLAAVRLVAALVMVVAVLLLVTEGTELGIALVAALAVVVLAAVLKAAVLVVVLALTAATALVMTALAAPGLDAVLLAAALAARVAALVVVLVARTLGVGGMRIRVSGLSVGGMRIRVIPSGVTPGERCRRGERHTGSACADDCKLTDEIHDYFFLFADFRLYPVVTSVLPLTGEPGSRNQAPQDLASRN